MKSHVLAIHAGMKKRISFLFLISVFVFSFSHAFPAQAGPFRIYVDADATGADDGSSWADAYIHLQDALDETNANGSYIYEIWVAEGVYYPDEDSDGDHTNNSQLEYFSILYNNVALYGGFSGSETIRSQRDWVAHPTILSGDIDGNDTNADGDFIADDWGDIVGSNTYHVVFLDGAINENITLATVIDGFTITAGGDISQNAGGVYCFAASSIFPHGVCSPTLRNLTIQGNRANLGGGLGLYTNYSGVSNPYLTEVDFINNYAHMWGGGMWASVANDAVGESSPVLVNVKFRGNYALDDGGGLHSIAHSGTSSPALTNVEFYDNQAGGNGGAVHMMASTGGTVEPVLTNVSFYGNHAGERGGAMYNYRSAMSGVFVMNLNNAILWGDTAGIAGPELNNHNAVPVITHSDIQGCGGSGGGWVSQCGVDNGGNIDLDPMYRDPGSGDLSLRSVSPAIDAGDLGLLPADITDLDEDGNIAETIELDLALNDRVENSDVDMGAYEHGPRISNVGFYVPSKYRWYLKNNWLDGWSGVTSFGFGGVSELVPLVGDWDGDGVDTPGFYKPSQWKWYLKNNHDDGWTGFTSFQWGGNAAMVPVAGDWDGDGLDTVGLYKYADCEWYLKDVHTDGWTNFTKVTFCGAAENLPITGDWDGDGTDTIGFFVPSQRRWYLKNDLADGWSSVTSFNWGTVSAYAMDPVAGDWDGDGVDTVGAYVADKWRWFLKDDQTDGWSNVSPVKFAVTADYVALAGDWK